MTCGSISERFPQNVLWKKSFEGGIQSPPSCNFLFEHHTQRVGRPERELSIGGSQDLLTTQRGGGGGEGGRDGPETRQGARRPEHQCLPLRAASILNAEAWGRSSGEETAEPKGAEDPRGTPLWRGPLSRSPGSDTSVRRGAQAGEPSCELYPSTPATHTHTQ